MGQNTSQIALEGTDRITDEVMHDDADEIHDDHEEALKNSCRVLANTLLLRKRRVELKS